MDDFVDRLRDGLSVLFDDKARFGAIFVVGAIILAVIIGANIAPIFTGFVHNPDLNNCSAAVLQQNIIFIPIGTYFTNPPLGQAQMVCPVLIGNYVTVGMWYVEIVVTLILAALAGIIALNLGG